MSIDPETLFRAEDPAALAHLETMQAFGVVCSDPEVIRLCEAIEHIAGELTERLSLDASDIGVLALVTGCALQRREIERAIGGPT